MKSFVVRMGHRVWAEVAWYLRRKPGKVFFDHLPKCGGTSLNRYLERQYPARRIYSIEWPDYHGAVERFKAMPEARRHGYDLVKGHLGIELIDHVHPDAFKFTVLRDPVDRVVSLYFYAKRDPKHYLYERLNSEEIGLTDYVADTNSPGVGNWYTGHFSGLSVDAVAADPDAALDKALSVLRSKFNLVGILENFSTFPQELQNGAGFAKPYAGERLNVTRGRPKIDDVSAETLEMIRTHNAADIRLYNAFLDQRNP